MTDVTTLRAQLDALEAARFRGIRVVQFAERSVTYKSDTDLANAAAALRDKIAALEGGKSSGNVRVLSHKGW